MENFSIQNISDTMMSEMNKAIKNINHLNIMVLGKSGVGKSTLINNMFNESLAETGIGKPVTQAIRKCEKEGLPISIYDTPGLELGGENAIKKILDEVEKVMNDGLKSGDINKAIHCIWYCVSSASHRFEDAEKDFIDRFTSEASKYNVPVIVVLTQSYSKDEAKVLKSEIEKENLDIVQVVPVLAQDFEGFVKAYGLDRLVEISESVIPEAVKDTFIAVQKTNLKIKKRKAQVIVAAATACTAVVGAAPIPFSDFAKIPAQISMLVGITKLFGISIEKSTISALVSSTVGITGTTVASGVLTNLIKLIPGVGSLVGGTISASTAATFTAALGEAYIGVMSSILKGEMKASDLKANKGKDKFTELLKKELSDIKK